MGFYTTKMSDLTSSSEFETDEGGGRELGDRESFMSYLGLHGNRGIPGLVVSSFVNDHQVKNSKVIYWSIKSFFLTFSHILLDMG